MKSYLLKIIKVDSNGNSIAEVLSSKVSNNLVNIPFNRNNIVFKSGDTVCALIDYTNKRINKISIIRKVNELKSFFGVVNKITEEFATLKKIHSKEENIYFIPINKLNKNQIYIGSILKVKEVQSSKNNLIKTYNPEKHYSKFNENNILALLAIDEFKIKDSFSKTVLNESEKINNDLLDDRKNLSNLPFITIDGEDAKDFDDAVYAEKVNNNLWKIIISIADVSHYVKEGSHLDHCASERGNSVYFPNYVVPMLPEKLSNDICSLKPNNDRLCVSVEILLDNTGLKISHKFFKSIIKSKIRYTYEQVEELIKNNFTPNEPTNPEIIKNVNNLFKVYKKLKILSSKRGSLGLKISETKILFDENDVPIDVIKSKHLQSHQIIEELMILANVCAAEELSKFNKENPYRIHEKPRYEKILSLINNIGKPFDKTIKNNPINSKIFNKILEQAMGHRDYNRINELILRTQSVARYNNINKGHFGLSLKKYVHFTSPIRRYSDLIVHRTLSLIIDKKKQNKFKNFNLKDLCDHISNTERNAILAERLTLDRYKTLIYSKKINKNFVGEIISVKNFGLFVSFDNEKNEGFVPKRFLPRDKYFYNEKKETLSGKSHFFGIGMSILVSIKDADIYKGKILLSYLKLINIKS